MSEYEVYEEAQLETVPLERGYGDFDIPDWSSWSGMGSSLGTGRSADIDWGIPGHGPWSASPQTGSPEPSSSRGPGPLKTIERFAVNNMAMIMVFCAALLVTVGFSL